MATDKPNRSRTGCAAEGDVFERATMASVVGRDMNSDCKLILGNCLDVLKDIESGSVDMVLADLPYGTTACKWDVCISFESLWEQLHRVTKPNAAMCMFGSEPFSSQMRMSNLKRFKYDWIWQKHHATGHLNAKKRPMKSTEIISVFGGNTYFPQGLRSVDWAVKNSDSDCRRGKDNITSTVSGGLKKDYHQAATGYPKDILSFASANGNKDHPTQKPVALLEYLIKTYTNEGDTVLDPTMGSGSTGVACKNLNRNFIGIEMDEKYFEIAKRRIGSCNLQAEFK